MIFYFENNSENENGLTNIFSIYLTSDLFRFKTQVINLQ